MKKILLSVTIIFLTVVSTLVFFRYKNNKLQVIPYPFYFKKDTYSKISIDAPIVILGDRMGERLSLFKSRLAEKLSTNLSRPIKIDILTGEDENIHRSLHKIKQLKKLPLIIIYIGNLDQEIENVLPDENISQVNLNLKLYQNDYIRSAIMLFPELAKLVYFPVNFIQLSERIIPDKKEYTDPQLQMRRIIQYKLFEFAFEDLIKFTKKNNSLLIPLTTPLNLKNKAVKSCYGSLSSDAKKEVEDIKALIEKKDFKSAYNLSKDLALLNSNNAQILHLHSLVAFKLNLFKEYQKFGEMSLAMDCGKRPGSPVYNSIIKSMAKRHEVVFFDYHQLLTDESKGNFVFLDEVYPQDFYIEKLIDILAQQIKRRLRL